MLARLKYSKLESRPEYRMFMKMDGIRDQRHSNSELTELALFSQLGSTKWQKLWVSWKLKHFLSP